MSIRDTIKEALDRVRDKEGDEKDIAIAELVAQVRQLRKKREDETPVHKQTPWYMK